MYLKHLSYKKKTGIVDIVLRIGIAGAFLYPAIDAFFFPQNWIGFFPAWITMIPVSDVVLLHLFGIFEIGIALWILFGKKIFLPSLLAFLSLLAIVVVNWQLIGLLFRDITLLALPLGLMILHFPSSDKRRK